MSYAVTVQVAFEGLTAAQTDAAVESLAAAVKRLGVADSTERLRDRDDTQDFGATLAIVIAAPATLALAKGIADWIRKRDTGEITVTGADGMKVKVTGGPAADVDVNKLVQIMKGAPKKK